MSTSYTSNLKLGKPTAGDTGWGDVVNNELTDMIEQAVVGLATVNTWVGNSHTLTTADGSSSEARCAILKLTDTTTDLTGAGTVIVQPVTKLYVVINTTGQTITVKTASGTGIAVKTANQVNVVCDGTNVVEQDNYSNSLVAATFQTDSLVLATGATLTEIKTAISEVAADTKGVTEKAVRDYVIATGSLRRSERFYPWGSISGSTAGTQPPTIAIGEDETTTVATFDLHSTAASVVHELDLTITGTAANSGTHSNPVSASIVIRVQRKSTGATGTSIGAVTVADAKLGGSSSYWYSIGVAGDQTSKIDSFSYLDDAADGASKKKIQSATWDDATDRTTIVYDNAASSAGLYSGTGGAVYISSSGFESVGTWVTATPYTPDESTEGLNYTFNITEILPINSSGAAIGTQKTHVLPKLKLVKDSGGVGDVEMRVQVSAGLSTGTGQYTFNILQVDQTNITRPV
jgi:hypothetical protein